MELRSGVGIGNARGVERPLTGKRLLEDPLP